MLSDEERLIDDLFTHYRKTARPVMSSSDTVPVLIQFSLMHLKELVSCIDLCCPLYWAHIIYYGLYQKFIESCMQDDTFIHRGNMPNLALIW